MLAWIEPNEPLPELAAVSADSADSDEIPSGLIAAGRDLSAARLIEAYSRGIFPWYVEGQPVLWWSPDPRMVLHLDDFSVPRSLGKTIRRVRKDGSLKITLDTAFGQVMDACAEPRDGQDGTWITNDMLVAYADLHKAGIAHSVEVWNQSPAAGNTPPTLVGGLYGVAIGRMFYGESMFARASDTSKIALVFLVQMLKSNGFSMIDCQQNTAHLARFGAREISRTDFLAAVHRQISMPAPDWQTMGQEIQAA